MRIIMDSLRYWADEMRVDGFRFDLAAALARELHDVNLRSTFLQRVQQDPLPAETKLIAEPWDVGPGGYQVGNFPPDWVEWNGMYRNAPRDYWRGEEGGPSELALRFTGSPDLYEGDERHPIASINFVTAHDGFTLEDLVSYDRKYNEKKGWDNEDGSDDHLSWNRGVEGPTHNADVRALRDRQKRNFMATLLLSQGVPMIPRGDELGRTQRGSNNAYCQDNEISWFDWERADGDFLEFARGLVRFRRAHPVFRRRRWFMGQPIHGAEAKDIAWFRPDGAEMSEEDWEAGFARSLMVFVNGESLPSPGPRGERIVDDSFLQLFNAAAEPDSFALPPSVPANAWRTVVDTDRALRSSTSSRTTWRSRVPTTPGGGTCSRTGPRAGTPRTSAWIGPKARPRPRSPTHRTPPRRAPSAPPDPLRPRPRGRGHPGPAGGRALHVPGRRAPGARESHVRRASSRRRDRDRTVLARQLGRLPFEHPDAAAALDARIVAEKSLEPGELPRSSWEVDGTTGYDFLNRVGGLYVDPAVEEGLTDAYVRVTAKGSDYDAVVRDCRARACTELLGSDLNRLTELFRTVAEGHRRHRDHLRTELGDALVKVAANFPAYRTYSRAEQGEIAAEDTAFYRCNRFVARNEVGGDPSRFGTSPEAFHRASARIRGRWPRTLLATSTHDTKRSEDVRARLHLFSEIPAPWTRAVPRWSETNAVHRRRLLAELDGLSPEAIVARSDEGLGKLRVLREGLAVRGSARASSAPRARTDRSRRSVPQPSTWWPSHAGGETRIRELLGRFPVSLLLGS